MRCPHGHAMQLSKYASVLKLPRSATRKEATKVDYSEGWTCDSEGCGEDGGIDDARYLCTQCGLDYCSSCVEKLGECQCSAMAASITWDTKLDADVEGASEPGARRGRSRRGLKNTVPSVPARPKVSASDSAATSAPRRTVPSPRGRTIRAPKRFNPEEEAGRPQWGSAHQAQLLETPAAGIDDALDGGDLFDSGDEEALDTFFALADAPLSSRQPREKKAGAESSELLVEERQEHEDGDDSLETPLLQTVAPRVKETDCTSHFFQCCPRLLMDDAAMDDDSDGEQAAPTNDSEAERDLADILEDTGDGEGDGEAGEDENEAGGATKQGSEDRVGGLSVPQRRQGYAAQRRSLRSRRREHPGITWMRLIATGLMFVCAVASVVVIQRRTSAAAPTLAPASAPTPPPAPLRTSLPFLTTVGTNNQAWRNNWTGEIGYEIQVNTLGVNVTALGRLVSSRYYPDDHSPGGLWPVLKADANITIWDSATKQIVASATVGPRNNPNRSSVANYVFAPLPAPVALEHGKKYRVSLGCTVDMPDLWPDSDANSRDSLALAASVEHGVFSRTLGAFPDEQSTPGRWAGAAAFMMQAPSGTSFIWSCHLGSNRFSSADAQCDGFPGAVRDGCFGHNYNWEAPKKKPKKKSRKKPKREGGLATSIEQPTNFTSNTSASNNATGGAGATEVMLQRCTDGAGGFISITEATCPTGFDAEPPTKLCPLSTTPFRQSDGIWTRALLRCRRATHGNLRRHIDRRFEYFDGLFGHWPQFNCSVAPGVGHGEYVTDALLGYYDPYLYLGSGNAGPPPP